MTMRKTLALLLILALIPACMVDAQAKGRPSPQFARPDQIDPAEGTKILAAFRSARTQGDYAFSFELVNRPKDGAAHTFCGSMWGTWDARGHALTRADISLEGGHTLRMIYKGGTDGGMIRAVDDAPAVQIAGAERFSPIVEGLTFSPFELQMPFMYWTDYVYEGTRKLLGRPAHYFLLYPPKDFESADVGAVRVTIDADFLVMLSAEELDKDGNPLKSFRINDFAKVDGQWIVKEIDLVDPRTKDRTRFRVVEARMGLALPAEVFVPGANSSISPIAVRAPDTKSEAGEH
jgi:hypothetical protein